MPNWKLASILGIALGTLLAASALLGWSFTWFGAWLTWPIIGIIPPYAMVVTNSRPLSTGTVFGFIATLVFYALAYAFGEGTTYEQYQHYGPGELRQALLFWAFPTAIFAALIMGGWCWLAITLGCRIAKFEPQAPAS